MEPVINELAHFLSRGFAETPQTERYIVGIAGVPASGKTTLAQKLVHRTNQLLRERSQEPGETVKDVAALIGMDGWHLTRAQLDAFPNAKLAHDRRGAHWTFDGDAYVAFVQALRQPLPQSPSADEPVIYAPSFSHELKDPTPRAVAVHPHHRLIIIEGLYSFLSIEPWVQAGKLLNERWWVELSEEEAKARLVLRHVFTGVAKDAEEAEWRARENDAPNGRFIKENMLEPTRVIHSVEEVALKMLSMEA
ncbi:P-loop containing nucleoside triphosphate hydrolase protein [Trametopsis cervina]|nr:P-loop containing nucleoside triphosphate hydrolase protein [Trametopsis cervina]